MFNFLRSLIMVIFMLSICLSQSKNHVIFDQQQLIQNEFEFAYGKDWIFKWNLNHTPHRIFGNSISQEFDGSDAFQI